jgi:Sec-independent protein translocase protein TatA
MFDISYSPWIILALVGLIFFRPDDWQDLAFHAGRWGRRIHAYVLEWQEYFEFTSTNQVVKKVDITKSMVNGASSASDLKIWPQKVMGSRVISVSPYF